MADKPITSDPDEQELLKSLNIPLTDPAAKDVDETHTETTADGTPVETPAAAADTVEGDAAGDAGGTSGKGADEPVPAPADAEPAAGEPEPADGGGDGTAPATPAKPAVTPPATTTPTPILSDAAKRMAEVEELILADEFDPFSKEGRKLQLEHNKLAAKVEAEPLITEKRQADAYKPYIEQFPAIEPKQMQQVFAKHTEAYAKRGYTGDALNAAATVAFELELAQIANGKKGAEVAKEKTKGAVVAPPVAKTPITPKGAIVAPPSAVSTPAAPRRELSDEEELVATQRKLNPQGMRAALRG